MKDMEEIRIELKDRTSEIIQSEKQRENRLKKISRVSRKHSTKIEYSCH